ncbi:PREDICTED: putative uncharacterized protein DDB_G0272516 isoform X1 [Priapulus caudatus]|uniref:Uncharacterized protein n=1 Tax=Priapulus caudatus TaxID=37621 RepID=A0ABM1DW74_PRICU|nr:PREDICTED: putative uncharacterized protein DDB_G0272516 isoform X1 [Priapulus caudatus]
MHGNKVLILGVVLAFNIVTSLGDEAGTGTCFKENDSCVSKSSEDQDNINNDSTFRLNDAGSGTRVESRSNSNDSSRNKSENNVTDINNNNIKVDAKNKKKHSKHIDGSANNPHSDVCVFRPPKPRYPLSRSHHFKPALSFGHLLLHDPPMEGPLELATFGLA